MQGKRKRNKCIKIVSLAIQFAPVKFLKVPTNLGSFWGKKNLYILGFFFFFNPDIILDYSTSLTYAFIFNFDKK